MLSDPERGSLNVATVTRRSHTSQDILERSVIIELSVMQEHKRLCELGQELSVDYDVLLRATGTRSPLCLLLGTDGARNRLRGAECEVNILCGR